MRKHEVYSVECVGCGRTIESETTQFACPFCGLLIRLEWGGNPQPAAAPRAGFQEEDGGRNRQYNEY
jgi:hypothetical protein